MFEITMSEGIRYGWSLPRIGPVGPRPQSCVRSYGFIYR